MVSKRDLIEAVGEAVRAYQRSTDALDDAVARRLKVNRTDLRCLDWLFDGPLGAGTLAELTSLSTGATTAMLDRLEIRGLVQRVRDSDDRRKVLVEMTDAGRRRCFGLYGPIMNEGSALLDRYTEANLRLFVDYFEHARALSEAHAQRIQDGE